MISSRLKIYFLVSPIGAGALVLFMFKAMRNLKPVTIHPGGAFCITLLCYRQQGDGGL